MMLAIIMAGGASARSSQDEIGKQTRQWLELQRSQAQASQREERPLPEASARIKRRVLDSFSHPIPERYIKRDFRE